MHVEWWRYFGTDETTALLELRSKMGPAWATAPTDAVLIARMSTIVEFLHQVTGRVFVRVDTTLRLNGQDRPRVNLPLPIISVEQGGLSITSVTLDGDSLELDELVFNEGCGLAGDDPREDPFVEFDHSSSNYNHHHCPYHQHFRYGVQNIHVTGSFGYVNGVGETPFEIMSLLTRMLSMATSPIDDGSVSVDACGQSPASIISETVADRSITCLLYTSPSPRD